jgi:hypothetical protein
LTAATVETVAIDPIDPAVPAVTSPTLEKPINRVLADCVKLRY